MDSHETYVSLETAKLLKQAGFDWETFGYYNKLGFFHRAIPRHGETSAPILTIAQKWLREVKGWEIQVACGIDKNGRKTYVTELINPEIDLIDYKKYFLTYEETLESGIKKCLEILLENK